jgi:hypothetical protein
MPSISFDRPSGSYWSSSASYGDRPRLSAFAAAASRISASRAASFGRTAEKSSSAFAPRHAASHAVVARDSASTCDSDSAVACARWRFISRTSARRQASSDGSASASASQSPTSDAISRPWRTAPSTAS